MWSHYSNQSIGFQSVRVNEPLGKNNNVKQKKKKRKKVIRKQSSSLNNITRAVYVSSLTPFIQHKTISRGKTGHVKE